METSTPVPCGGGQPPVIPPTQQGAAPSLSITGVDPNRKVIFALPNGIATFKSLVIVAGLKEAIAQDLVWGDTPSWELVDPEQKTIYSIMEQYCLASRTSFHPFFAINKLVLGKMVKRIDYFPKELGHLYGDVLQDECARIVSTPIVNLWSAEQLASPFQCYYLNKRQFECPFLEVALILCAMFSLMRQNNVLALADWSKFIVSVQDAKIDQMPAAIMRAFYAMLDGVKNIDRNEALKRLQEYC